MNGPAGVFLRDRDGLWRFDSEWTRDAWQRAPGPHVSGWTFTVFKDAGTSHEVILLVTSPTLLASHPRGDIRTQASS